MNTAASIAGLPKWQQQRVTTLHYICQEIETEVRAGTALRSACKAAAERHEHTLLEDARGKYRELPLSEGGLVTKYYAWTKAERTPSAFAPKYGKGRARIPRECINEFQRRQTLPGVSNARAAYRSLVDDWQRGRTIEGLGNWSQWWSQNRKDFPLPDHAPDFPFSYQGMMRYKASRAAKNWGNKGKAAAIKEMPWLTRDSSELRPGEVYVFDDVRLDLLAIDELTKRPTEHQVYIGMEWGTRYIPSYVMRPANAILQADVDALVVACLQSFGVGKDYVTHLIFERGSLTMSREAAAHLEAASGDLIKVHFTSMNGARPHAGSPMEVGKGHWMGKAVIESFMRQLHARLLLQPGQRGNKYENQPATLGHVGQHKKARPGTLVDEAQKLVDLQLHFGDRVKLNLGLLWTSELNTILRDVVRAHNDHRDHTYQGFGRITERETAPGVWEDQPCLS